MHEITLISGNLNKVNDLSQLLGLKLKHKDIELVEIQSTNVVDVIKHKAREAYAKLGSPVLVDDAGLTIEHWGKLPGALIKYFITEIGLAGILEMLGDAPRDAYMEML